MSGFDSTRIYDEAKACENQFRKTIAKIQHGKSVMQEFQQRFWAWATNTGVFAEPFLSLDVRLGGHEQPVTMIVSLLKLLKVNLEAVLRLDLAFCHTSVQVQYQEPEMHEKSYGNNEEYMVSSNAIEHLEGPLSGVGGCIQRLFRIAKHISQSSQTSLQGRMDSFARRHEIDFKDFENLMGTIVEFKFPGMQTSFKAQLVRSAVYQRQRILYQRYRKKRLEAHLVPRQTETKAHENLVPDHKAVEAQSTPLPTPQTQTLKPPPSESLRPSTFDGDLFKKEIYREPENQSDKQSTISAWTGQVEYPRAPGLSDALAGVQGLLECPYCIRLFPSTDYSDGQWWRDHVNQDLKPYICISEDCATAQPPIRFARSRKWREHMEKTHGTYWSQHIHGNWSSETERPAETCPMCETAVDRLPTTESGHDSTIVDCHPTTKPSNRTRRVRFDDDENTNNETDLPLDTGRHLQLQEHEIMDPDKIKLTKHIAQHLLSWCFLSLRNGVDEPDLEVETNERNGTVNSKRLDQGNSGIDSIMQRLSLNFEETRPLDLDLELVEDAESPFPSDDRNEWGECLQEKPYDAEKDRIIQHFAERRARPALREATLRQLESQSHRLRKSFREAEIDVEDRRDSTKHRWIPLSSINEILQNDTGLLNSLEEESNNVKDFVLLKAKRLVSVLFLQGCVDWLKLFYSEDFSDEHFPVKLLKPATSASRSPLIWTIQSCNTKKTVSLWHTNGNDDIRYPYEQRDKMEDFCSYFQWQSFVPVFSPQQPSHILDPYCQLPYLDEIGEDEIGEDMEQIGFNIVRHFVIHRAHLNFEGDGQIGTVVDDQGNPHIAVKEILSAEGLSREKFYELAETETSILGRSREQGHPHLLRTLAVYTQGHRHYVMLPWAMGGNLWDLWAKQPTLSVAASNISSQDWHLYFEWFFVQLLGVSSALENLHNPNEDSELTFRHGDLKPDHILCFSDTVIGRNMIPTGVRLVVAHAGHASVHHKFTEFRGEQTEPQRGTRTYSPPEAELRPHNARSRRYDIWSLGCLYLEFLIWVLYGNSTLKSFRQDVGPSEPYYRKDPEVELKDSVKRWIKTIQEDPRCTPIKKTAVGRLISLIEKRMLVANIESRKVAFQPNSASELDIRGSSPISTDDPTEIIVRPSMFKRTDFERANSKEVCEEIQSILNAARMAERSLPWINQDGIAEAAQRGPPGPQ